MNFSSKTSNIVRKILLCVICILLVILFIMLGVRLGSKNSDAAAGIADEKTALSASSSSSAVEITADLEQVTPGDTFTLTIKITSERAGYWGSANLYISLINANGDYDEDVAQYLSLVDGGTLNSEFTDAGYKGMCMDYFRRGNMYNQYGIYFPLMCTFESKVSTEIPIEIAVTVRVSHDMPADKIQRITFGVMRNKFNKVMIVSEDNRLFFDSTADNFHANSITMRVKSGGFELTHLQLKEGMLAQFMVEEISENAVYRRTYAELGWEHGIDDTQLERFVIGQILPETSVYAFLDNFEEALWNSIRIYNSYGILLYDCGNPAEGIREMELQNSYWYRIGTGWYLEFVSDGEVEETVYLSVLGDMNGDGYVNGDDASILNLVVSKLFALESTEYRLAAYLKNDGIVDSADVVALESVIEATDTVTDYFYVSVE